MSTAQYRCLVAHMMYWERGLTEALTDCGILHLDRGILIEELWKAGYTYHPASDTLTYDGDL